MSSQQSQSRFEIGDNVELFGLVSRTDLNGKRGEVIRSISDSPDGVGRLGVRMESSGANVMVKCINVKPAVGKSARDRFLARGLQALQDRARARALQTSQQDQGGQDIVVEEEVLWRGEEEDRRERPGAGPTADDDGRGEARGGAEAGGGQVAMDTSDGHRGTSHSPVTRAEMMLQAQSNLVGNKPLVWIDLEMTGLDPEVHTIIEIAVMVTDGTLRHIRKGPNVVIHQPEGVIANMNDWSREQHGASGLTDKVRKSTISLDAAERMVVEFISTNVEKGVAQIAGNGIHLDCIFLKKYMPGVMDQLCNRKILDVTSVREACRRFNREVYKRRPMKVQRHTAMSDIEESLEELRHYQENVFMATGSGSGRRKQSRYNNHSNSNSNSNQSTPNRKSRNYH